MQQRARKRCVLILMRNSEPHRGTESAGASERRTYKIFIDLAIISAPISIFFRIHFSAASTRPNLIVSEKRCERERRGRRKRMRFRLNNPLKSVGSARRAANEAGEEEERRGKGRCLGLERNLLRQHNIYDVQPDRRGRNRPNEFHKLRLMQPCAVQTATASLAIAVFRFLLHPNISTRTRKKRQRHVILRNLDNLTEERSPLAFFASSAFSFTICKYLRPSTARPVNIEHHSHSSLTSRKEARRDKQKISIIPTFN